jgi:hypothetical protein
MNIDSLCSTCQVFQMTKKENTRKKYGLLPPKIAEYNTQSLGHGLCGSGGFIYNKDVEILSIFRTDPEAMTIKAEAFENVLLKSCN